MARILVIEDERGMAYGLRDNFEFDGHEVALAFDGEEGLRKAEELAPDLIILDLMLPKKSGFDVCRELRAAGSNTPIIMLTARGQEIDKVLGLELGADDYITKPFSVRELLARVKAVLRRAGEPGSVAANWRRVGRLLVDFEHYQAQDERGQEVEMSVKEFDLLNYLVSHPGRAVSRDELLDKVWGYDNFPTSRTVDNFVVKLRKKVEVDPSKPRRILTVHGVGYKYVP